MPPTPIKSPSIFNRYQGAYLEVEHITAEQKPSNGHKKAPEKISVGDSTNPVQENVKRSILPDEERAEEEELDEKLFPNSANSITRKSLVTNVREDETLHQQLPASGDDRSSLGEGCSHSAPPPRIESTPPPVPSLAVVVAAHEHEREQHEAIVTKKNVQTAASSTRQEPAAKNLLPPPSAHPPPPQQVQQEQPPPPSPPASPHPADRHHSSAAAAAAASDDPTLKPKSLWLALVLKNPFFYATKRRPHVPPPGSLKGYALEASFSNSGTAFQNQANMLKKENENEGEQRPAKQQTTRSNLVECSDDVEDEVDSFLRNETTLLEDDDLLKRPNYLLKKDLDAPNDFQKMIELLLRLKKRQLYVLPGDVLERCEAPDPRQPWNFLGGYRLNASKLLLSPDRDEAYFRIHASRSTLLAFAEKQSLTLRTNPYSYSGGLPMVYDRQIDAELKQSVKDYMKHFSIPDADAYCRGKNDEGFGFVVEVPQKMRLLIRLLREGWIFGGCGLQLDEMKELGILVVAYFPLHNEVYLKEYGIDQWASFSALIKPNLMLKDTELALIHYFGESVAIYFAWLRQYILYLVFPAAFGLVCGILREISGLAPASIGGIYAAVVVLYMSSWIRKWQRYEGRFSHRWGQDIEERQEMVRDRFVYERTNIVDVDTIFSMQFEYPLTMHQLSSDGTMVELHFPHRKRLLRRYLVSYPIILAIAGAMVAALYFTQRLRFENAGNLRFSIIASVISVTISVVFGKIFNVLVQLLNLYENARTESENENELITKSFIFYFVSTYFSAFSICLWPSSSVVGGTSAGAGAGAAATFTESDRLFELRSQLIVELAVLPAVQNIVELVLPRFGAMFRRKVDETGGIINAINSLFCCCCCCSSSPSSSPPRTTTTTASSSVSPTSSSPSSSSAPPPPPPPQVAPQEGSIQHTIWTESQLEPYANTAQDFLEITLQYGWTVLFAAAFPWAPLLALVYNIIEVRVDAVKLIRFCQRPTAKVSASIGAWLPILWFLNILAVVTNSYFVIFISPATSELALDSSNESLLRYFIYSQYFFAILIGTIVTVRGDTSPTAKKAQVKRELLRDRSVQSFVTRSLRADANELKMQAAERLKRFALLSGGGAGAGGDGGDGSESGRQTTICSIETFMNICLPSFCIPQGGADGVGDGDDDDDGADHDQQQQQQQGNQSFGRDSCSPPGFIVNHNQGDSGSNNDATYVLRGNRSTSSLNPHQHQLLLNDPEHAERQRTAEQEEVMLRLSRARVHQLEKLIAKTNKKILNSPSSHFQVPTSTWQRPASPSPTVTRQSLVNGYNSNNYPIGSMFDMNPEARRSQVIGRDRQQNPFEEQSQTSGAILSSPPLTTHNGKYHGWNSVEDESLFDL